MRAGDNPFAVSRAAALPYRFAGSSREALLARFAALDHRAALVGPMGRGKTTLLRELVAALAAAGWRIRPVVLRDGDRRLPAATRESLLADLGRQDLLVVDGAQELGALPWRRLLAASRRAGGLLITSHREGLLPTLHRCETSPALLAALIEELLAGRAAPPAALPTAEDLHAGAGGDLRQALLAAYDCCARS